MSSLGCLELGGRMTAEWVRSSNFLQVFVTVEVKKQPLSKGCCCLVSARAVLAERYLGYPVEGGSGVCPPNTSRHRASRTGPEASRGGV